MTISFLPILGGSLIGLSAIVLLLSLGRIAGISGVVWGAIARDSSDRDWRLIFILGLLAGAFLFHAVSGVEYPAVNANYLLAGIAGLVVGVGVKLGNGCTSGHGVCGIGRLSPRSLVATVTFMGVAIATVALTKHVLGVGS